MELWFQLGRFAKPELFCSVLVAICRLMKMCIFSTTYFFTTDRYYEEPTFYCGKGVGCWKITFHSHPVLSWSFVYFYIYDVNKETPGKKIKGEEGKICDLKKKSMTCENLMENWDNMKKIILCSFLWHSLFLLSSVSSSFVSSSSRLSPPSFLSFVSSPLLFSRP